MSRGFHKVGVFTRQSDKDRMLNELIDKFQNQIEKPTKKDKELKYTITQRILLLHYLGVFSYFNKKKDLNDFLSIVLGCHTQSVKEITTEIDDFTNIKTKENLNFCLAYFKEINLVSAIDMVKTDIDKLNQRPKK